MTCETADVKRPKEKQTVGLLPPPFPIKDLSAAPADRLRLLLVTDMSLKPKT